MGELTNSIRAKASQLITLANGIITDANALDEQVPPPSGQTGVDCLSGTPVAPAFLSGEQDMPLYNIKCAQFDADFPSQPDGTILYIGDSITQYMSVPANSYNAGISGDTLRGVLNRINRNGGANLIHRAGAVVLLIGINDLVFETGLYSENQAIADVNYMHDLLFPYMVGKWIIVKPLPINTTIYTNPNGRNSAIDAVGNYIQAKYAGKTGVAIVDAKSALAPSGQLNPAYTPAGDGVHLNAAGYAVLQPLIQTALQSIGVTWG